MPTALPREQPPTSEGDATSRGQGGGEARNSFRVPLKTRCLKEELEKSTVIDWLIEMYVF